MLPGLEYVQETIGIRESDISGNSFETNNLLMEDILLALGYNKRREPGVKAIYAGEVEWGVSSKGNKRFIVTVYGYGEADIDGDKLNGAINIAEYQSFPFVVATNGLQLSVYTSLGDLIFKIDNIFDDKSTELLELLSNDKFDVDNIMSHRQEAKLNTDELNKILVSDIVIDTILNEQQNPVSRELIKEAVESLIGNKDNKQNETDTEQLNLEKARVKELESSIDSEKAKVHELEQKLAEATQAVAGQDTETSVKTAELEKQLAESSAKIAELDNELTLSKSKIAELEKQLAERDTEINKLKTELDSSVSQNEADETKAQLTELNDKIEKLESEKSQLDNEYEQLKKSSSAESLKLAGLESKVTDLTSQLNSSKDEVARLTDELAVANSKMAETAGVVNTEEIDNLRQQVTGLTQEIELYKSQINDLNGQLADRAAEVSRLTEEQSNAKANEQLDDTNNGGNESYKMQIDHLQQSLDEARAENERLLAEKNDFSKGNKFDTEAAYRQRISDLIDERQRFLVELNATKEKLEELERKASGAEDEKIAMAKQLLEAVEDNVDLRRTYVGVVESKLFQVIELNKFVGICLQELFNAVEYDLMPILFDGDMFKIVKPAVRKDLLISTNAYDIDLSGLDEIEILSKLKKVFNNFPKVVFMCKTIGTLEDGQEVGLGAGTVLNAPQFISEIPLDDADGFDEVIDTTSPTYNSIDSSNANDFVDGVSQDIGSENLDEYIDEPPINNGIKLLGFALSDVDPVLTSPEDPIINLEAIGNPLFCFRIKNQAFYEILNDALISVLAMTNKATDSLMVLRNTDLRTINPCITTEPMSEDSIQILNTGYFVDVHSVTECVQVLLMLVDLLSVDKTQIYIYFSSEYNPDSSFQNNYLEVSQINVNKYLDLNDYAEVKDTIHCLLEGKSLDLIYMIPGIYEVASNLFTAVLAMKNNNKIQHIIKSYEDIALTIQDLLSVNPEINPDELINIINSLIRYDGELISKDPDAMKDGYSTFEVNGITYYMNNIQGFPVVLIFYYLNSIVYNNESSLDLRIQLNSTLYTVYKNGVDISDCEEYLASKIILELMEGKTKVIIPKK